MTGHDVDDSVDTGPGEGDSSRNVEAALRRALAGPATPEELADWDAVAAAYRAAANPQRRPRLRLVAGLPLSAAAAAAVLLPAGAVAAAYTGRLPAHVQHWAHRALAPIGVPAHRRSAPVEDQRHAVPPPSALPSHPHPAPRHGLAALPALEHARAVQLCVVLSRTPRDRQGQLLTALHRLLPRETDLHLSCRTLLLAPRARPHPHASAHPSASPFARPSASPSAAPRAATPTPSPTARGAS